MPITDKLNKVSNGSQPLPAQLSAPKSAGATSASLSSATGWDTTTAKHIRMYQTQVVNGQTVPNQSTICYYKATLSGTTLSNLQLIWSATGADQDYPSGATVDLSLTAGWADDLIDSVSTQHNHDGTHKAITGPSAVFSGTVTASNFIQSGGAGAEGWTLGLPTPNTVTYNGNRSYDLVFNGDDITDTVSPGMRLRTTRTVTAPTQCTSLNGTSQYFTKSSPAGAAQTDDITPFGWVKPNSYVTGAVISKSSTPGTNGWRLYMDATGQVYFNGAGRYASSYQSLPLNKWSHIAATVDMSANAVQIYIDGVAVPTSTLGGAGASWTNAGNLEVGSNGGGAAPFPGKIAQTGFSSTVLSAANIRLLYSQGITSAIVASHSIVSAYSFDNSINDLNTTNANNLTASGAVVATNADSPFSVNGFGTATGTTDYAIIQRATFSTNTTLTVQVPEGNTIPTSGGITAVAYSTSDSYGMPAEDGKWTLETFQYGVLSTQALPTKGTYYNVGSLSLNLPTGSWNLSATVPCQHDSGTSGFQSIQGGLSTATSTASNIKLIGQASGSPLSTVAGNISVSDFVQVTSSTVYYAVTTPSTGAVGTISNLYIRTLEAPLKIQAVNAYL